MLDRLTKLGYKATGYNDGRKADRSDRYYNRRAESHWNLAKFLEREKVLFEELSALKYRSTPSGQVQVEAKADLKARIGRSPDRADALAMLIHPPRRGRRAGFGGPDGGSGGVTFKGWGGYGDHRERPPEGRPVTDQEAVERAADAIRSFQRHRNRDGQRPWEGRPPLEILEAHVGRFDSSVISLARRALERADEPST